MAIVQAPALTVQSSDGFGMIRAIQNYMDKESQKKMEYDKLALEAAKTKDLDPNWAYIYANQAQDLNSNRYNERGQGQTQNYFNPIPTPEPVEAERASAAQVHTTLANLNTQREQALLTLQKDDYDRSLGLAGLPADERKKLEDLRDKMQPFINALRAQLTVAPPSTIQAPTLNVSVPGTPPLQPAPIAAAPPMGRISAPPTAFLGKNPTGWSQALFNPPPLKP